MSESDVIKEFLVGLGFKVDKAGLDRFNAGIAGATKAVFALAAGVEAAGAAVVAATAKIADGLEGIYFASQRTGAAAENIKALGFAAAQAGAGVGNVQGSLEGVARFMRSNPGSEGFIASLGVRTKDANGQLRDTSTIMADLGTKFRSMPFYQAQAYANVLGIDERTLMGLRSGEIAKGVGEYADLVRRSGVDMQGATKGSHEFMSQLRSLGAVFDILAIKVQASLSKAIGGNIQAFREVLLANIGRISDGIAVVSTVVIRVAALVTDAVLAVGKGMAALWEEYDAWKKGGKTFIDWSAWEPGITAAKEAIIYLKDLIVAFWVMLRDDAWPAIKKFVEDVKPALSGLWGVVRAELKAFWDDLKAFYTNLRDEVWPAIKHFCEDAGPAFKQLFGTTIKEQVALATAEVKGFINMLTNVVRLLTAIRSGDWEGAKKAASDLYGQSGVSEGLTTREGSPAETLKNEGVGGLWRRYAPTWLGGNPAGGATHPQAGAAINKQAAAKESFDFWKSKGLTDSGAAAMVATEQRESGFDPAARGDKDASGNFTAHGLYQHHADRRAAILKATGIDMSTASAAQQREGLYQEMARGLDPQAAAALLKLRSARNIGDATDATVNGIERPGDRAGAQANDARVAAQWLPLLRGDAGAHAPAVQDAIRMREQALRAAGMSGGVPTPLIPANSNTTNNSTGPALTQTTNIHVNADGVSDLADRVASAQERQNQSLVRNMQGAAR